MALPQWTEKSGYKIADIDERKNIELPLPLASTSGVTVTLIAGQLPPGLRIENYALKGVPFEVQRTTDFEFTLRASTVDGVLDRTFNITVNGADAPLWITPEGVLNIGAKPAGEYWIDTRYTKWGMFESNGVNAFTVQDVTVSETKLSSSIGSNGDYSFVTSEHQFYYKWNNRWRRMTEKQLQSAVAFDTTIAQSPTQPQANEIDFWFNTNKDTNGLDLKLKTYDDNSGQWVDKSYIVSANPPPTPGNQTVWIQTFNDSLSYIPKIWDAGENTWQVLKVTYDEVPPDNITRAFFVLDNTIVDFQLTALDTDLAAGDNLRYYIANDEGELPPGLSLSEDGRISGIVEPLLALDKDLVPGYDSGKYDLAPLDFAVVDDDGYDSYYYDTTFYGFSTPTRKPKKLNRYYNFTVTVADNVGETKREFSIYLVGDDFLRADNTIMKSGTGLFTADVTYLRNPVFLTPGDLGVRRAHNYVTLYIDTLDPNSLLGVISYRLLPYNDDGTDSELPPGMALDGITGEIAGIVPYQPAVSKDYRFTIEALRQEPDVDVIEVNTNLYEDTLSGKTSIKVYKTDPNDLASILGQNLIIGNFSYTVDAIDSTNEFYDVITLETPLEPLGIYQPLTIFEKQLGGRNWAYINEIPDRDIEFYKEKTLNFSSTESYKILFNTLEDLYKRPTPFLRYNISINDSAGFLEFDYDSAGVPFDPADTLFVGLEKYLFVVAPDIDLANDLRLVSESDTELVFDIKSTATTRNKNLISKVFHGTDSSRESITATIENYFIKIYFDKLLDRELPKNAQYSLGAVMNSNVRSRLTETNPNVARAVKTFSVRLLGEVESTVTWLTPSELPVQVANRVSYLKLQAETTLVGANLRYDLVGGKLPNGLELKKDGEIVGKINQYASGSTLGLTTIDSRSTTFDGGNTTLDRVFTFTVIARDRFGYSASMKEFTIRVDDVDDKVYTNVYMQPFLKTYQRDNFLNFINDYTVFTPSYIYRPSDPNFGVQKGLRTLAYAGIETKTISYFVAAVAKNHKKKRFNFGEIKTAVAKQPGSNDIVYEVVYIEVVDPKEPIKGETALSKKIITKNPITTDELKYEVKDDVTSVESGGDAFLISVRGGEPVRVVTIGGTITVGTRSGDVDVLSSGQIEIVGRGGSIIVVRSQSFTSNTSSDPLRYRPNGNVITADSDALKASQSTDNLKYITNISNMRKRIAEIGVNERQFLPLWMRTSQDSNIGEIDYVTAMPICYCKPGTAQLIKENIINAGYDFKSIDYEIDRYIIDSTTNNQTEQFVLFANYKFNV